MRKGDAGKWGKRKGNAGEMQGKCKGNRGSAGDCAGNAGEMEKAQRKCRGNAGEIGEAQGIARGNQGKWGKRKGNAVEMQGKCKGNRGTTLLPTTTSQDKTKTTLMVNHGNPIDGKSCNPFDECYVSYVFVPFVVKQLRLPISC